MKWDAATIGAVMWPAFLGAALADGIIFTLIDPETIEVLATHAVSRQAACTPLVFPVLDRHRRCQLPDALVARRESGKVQEHDAAPIAETAVLAALPAAPDFALGQRDVEVAVPAAVSNGHA